MQQLFSFEAINIAYIFLSGIVLIVSLPVIWGILAWAIPYKIALQILVVAFSPLVILALMIIRLVYIGVDIKEYFEDYHLHKNTYGDSRDAK